MSPQRREIAPQEAEQTIKEIEEEDV